MKKWSLGAVVAVFFLFLSPVSPADTPPPEAAAAAEAGLVNFLADLPSGDLPNFGFTEGEDLSGVRVGKPWLLYTITPDSLFSASERDPVERLIAPTGLWYFPAVLDGDFRAVVTVDLIDGQWEAVAFGAAPLAAELGKISRRWPKAKGYSPRLVAVYQAAAYFFTVPEKDSNNLTPLIFEGVGFRGYQAATLPDYSETGDLDELLGRLREAVRENIAAFPAAGGGGGE